MTKPKKKSLVGWTRQDWLKKMRLVKYIKYASEFYAMPCINERQFGRFGEPKVKVRITIEEIK